ncbi:MAG: insulinase family protein [Holosporaceae bacterium]|nr:insulinase family protein [Holosporaceae bacterium]
MKKAILALFFIFFGSKTEILNFTLENGLQVVCIEKKNLPIVCFSIWYKCGSKNDERSTSGVAHFLEHMAFMSNKGEFSNFLEDIGAEKNAFTSFNTICFFELISKENIETVLQHESSRMKHLQIDDEIFSSEKKAILEERSRNIDNDVMGINSEVFLANAFNRKAGGIPIIGWKHEIERITKEDLYQFHNKWFAPNNAIIVITGDFDVRHIKGLVEKYFGSVERKEISLEPVKNFTPCCQKEVKYGSPKNGSSAGIEYLYQVPFQLKGNFRKSIALGLAIEAMNQPNFFIKNQLKDIYSYAIETTFTYVRGIFECDVVGFEVGLANIDNISDVVKMWRYLKNRLLKTGILDSELAEVKRKRLLAVAHREDDIWRTSNYFGRLLSSGYSVEEAQSIDKILESITSQECNDVLREVFSFEPFAILKNVPKGYDRE